jgi:hypothetical protein
VTPSEGTGVGGLPVISKLALLILLMKIRFNLGYLRYLGFTYDLLTDKFLHVFRKVTYDLPMIYLLYL